jgi:hypothetical protein
MNTDPKKYYYQDFLDHFSEFVAKSNIHEHQNEGYFIFWQDINNKNLSHIPAAQRMLFIYALAFNTLIDQVMYAHFSTDYPAFQKITLYPKFELGLTNINVNPWSIAEKGWEGGGLPTFEKFSEFFIQDIKDFFGKHKFSEATWEKVKKSMTADPDIDKGKYGQIFIEKLKQ